MSGHFVYEIDERKLRVRLQELEMEPGPDDWSNFETFCHQSNHKNHDGQSLKMQVPISMNLLLPIVFGLVIVLIAVVLFRFINIKNPPPDEQPSIVNSAPIKQDSAPAIAPTQTKVASTDSLAPAKALPQPSLATINNDSAKINNTPAPEPSQASAKNDKSINNANPTDTGLKQKTEEKPRVKESALFPPKEGTKSKKKRQKKNSGENTEAEKTAEEIPSNPAEETEATMKPNNP